MHRLRGAQELGGRAAAQPAAVAAEERDGDGVGGAGGLERDVGVGVDPQIPIDGRPRDGALERLHPRQV